MRPCARRIRLRIINVSRQIQQHFRGDILNCTRWVDTSTNTYVHHYMREHRVCRFVGRNRSKAPSWRFCILFVGITIKHILSLPSLKTVAAWCWSVSLLNLYSIPPSLYIEKTTPCPMNFIETKVRIYAYMWTQALSFYAARHCVSLTFLHKIFTCLFWNIVSEDFYLSLFLPGIFPSDIRVFSEFFSKR